MSNTAVVIAATPTITAVTTMIVVAIIMAAGMAGGIGVMATAMATITITGVVDTSRGGGILVIIATGITVRAGLGGTATTSYTLF